MKLKKSALVISSLVMMVSVGTYAVLGSYSSLNAATNETETQSFEQLTASEVREQRIEKLQEHLRTDTQNAALWFQLGNAYMYNSEFDNAVIVFDYALRLNKIPTSSLLVAKASAIYYSSGQIVTDDVSALLSATIELEPYNQTALMMLATNEFMNVRYQKAIDIWQSLLDSDQQGLDRVTIINSINQAKQLL
ncbi:TPR domain-containing protein [Aliivibrio kagoshimensis]|uniref:TPR domain-containing protein n=1 Tax=Aliivibrio kagoshimensis TaxID=2910230 RepID=UPI003D0F392B